MIDSANLPRVLMLTPYLPYPPVSGGRTRTYNYLRQLARDHELTLVCFGRPEERAFDLAPLREYCALHVVEREGSPGTLRAASLSLTSPQPITMRLYRNPAMQKTLADLLNRARFDLIHVESFYMVQNLPAATTLPILLCEPSIEYKAWSRFARVAQPIYQRPAVALESLKMRVYEPRAWKRVASVGVMSEFDAGLVRRLAPGVRIAQTPNGVDTEFFQPAPETPRDTNSLLYMGDYKYFPNVEAVSYFMEAIMPLLRAARPGLTLTLLGKEPPEAFVKMAGDPARGLRVLGLVPDTRPYLQSSGVFICPQRSGGGTRFKLMEAMACGCAVVSTAMGAEGLGATDGVNIRLAETPRAFADAVLELLATPDLAARIGASARSLALERHSWARSAALVRELYQQLLKGTST